MAERFSEIKNDQIFEEYLERALALLADPAILRSTSHLVPSFEAQLRFMHGFAKERRKPSKAERDSVNAGLLVARELEPIQDLKLYELGQLLHETQYYFQVHYQK